MKNLINYINEGLKIGKEWKRKYAYVPKDKDELEDIIKYLTRPKQRGSNANLNDIDTSNITDMSYLFARNYPSELNFTGDISQWNTTNVTNMYAMFEGSDFNGDISEFDVSAVTNMGSMFAHAAFNQDISNWNVSCVEDMNAMFYASKFNKDISNWNVSKVTNMRNMFERSIFNQDISSWNVSNVNDMSFMFYKSKFNKNIDKWNTDIKHLKAKNIFDKCPLEKNRPKWYEDNLGHFI